MPTPLSDASAIAASRWLAAFAHAVADGDPPALRRLFHAESHWRDLLALTWNIGTVSGAGPIADALGSAASGALRNPQVDPARTPPRAVARAGVEAIEALVGFETPHGPGEGVLRLTPDPDAAGTLKAWTLTTALAALKDFPERVGASRPTGASYSRDFRGPNWLDRRREATAYADRDPAVLVVGGGQAGLSIAARLTQLNVDTLVVDRHPRIGDTWRIRYHALTLHNQVHVNHLPYMPYPPSWPLYVPKDKIANWFEAYAESLELNVWTEAAFEGATYDADAACWSATVRRGDGSVRVLRPRHVVMATGVSGIPNLPALPGLESFAGTRVHSSGYDDGAAWAGRRAIVIGTGNSGHDIAQDLHQAGAQVTMVQRSPTMVISIEPCAQLPYALYAEGPPLDDCDLITAGTPLAVAKAAHILMTATAKALDRPLLERLARVGFKLDFGPEKAGWQFSYLTRGGGYYFNVGCSDLIADGAITLLQLAEIAEIVPEGVRLDTGATHGADLIVLATGYKGLDHLVRKLFGEAVAERVGPIWGFGETQELRNMFQRTGQPGLWFIAGSFAQCRIYSRYLAMQIKACEEGLIAP